jgi:hypothetical protein
MAPSVRAAFSLRQPGLRQPLQETFAKNLKPRMHGRCPYAPGADGEARAQVKQRSGIFTRLLPAPVQRVQRGEQHERSTPPLTAVRRPAPTRNARGHEAGRRKQPNGAANAGLARTRRSGRASGLRGWLRRWPKPRSCASPPPGRCASRGRVATRGTGQLHDAVRRAGIRHRFASEFQTTGHRHAATCGRASSANCACPLSDFKPPFQSLAAN